MVAWSASHSRAAVSTTTSNTGSRSKLERLMTFSTSLVAVWYSSDSSRSRCAGAIAQQPRVLHRDHRLRGEVLQQARSAYRRTGALPADRRDEPTEQRSSLRSGTRKTVRTPPSIDHGARRTDRRLGRLLGASAIWTSARPSTRRRQRAAGPAVSGPVPHVLGERSGSPAHGCETEMLAVDRCRAMPNAAPHSRIAFSSIASNTGARSPGEELMTCNTSAVAVCCSSASRCLGDQPRVLHRDHRLRGEVLQQRDLLVGERPDLLAIDRDDAEQRLVLAQAARQARCARRRDRPSRVRSGSPPDRVLGRKIGDMDEPFASSRCADRGAASGPGGLVCAELGIGLRGTPRIAAAWNRSPSIDRKVAEAAPHSRIAFSSIASNTGARSPGEELMTCNTSAVAVCCSSASRCSVISRAFSIAMTA